MKHTIKLPLTTEERALLRRQKVSISQLAYLETDEVSQLLNISVERAAQLTMLARLQLIPSIGPKLAQDVVEMGYYSIAALKDKTGPELFDQLEETCRTRIDPCVEDQLRLLIHVILEGQSGKQWWDFTEERKQYRAEHGYRVLRPVTKDDRDGR